MRDRNGYELNTASTIAALLYGNGDFIETLKTAFNFGWDADNNAATSGTIIGVIKGYRWMMSQNWKIVDRYHNTTRDEMPADETITTFADRLIDLAEKVIVENGGQRKILNGQISFLIPRQEPANMVPMIDFDNQADKLRSKMRSEIEKTITDSMNDKELAFAAYSAICLDLAQSLEKDHPKDRSNALKALGSQDNVMQVLFFESPTPAGELLRKKALSAGLTKPKKSN